MVDHAPIGMKGELLETLRFLRRELPSTRTVLGLRDIVDDPAIVRRTWTQDHVYRFLEELYDRILVFGERRHFDIEDAYALSPPISAKLVYAGYIRKKEPMLPAHVVRAQLGLDTGVPFVLATVGGGGDGAAILERTIEALPLVRLQHPKLRAVVVTGPLMSEAEHEQIEDAARSAGGVHVTAFYPHMTSAMAAASATVSMGGYNTVTELLALGRPSIVVPRIEPRKEQLIRARILASRGLIEIVEPKPLEPARIADAIARCLGRDGARDPSARIDLGGTDETVSNILALARPLAPRVMEAR